MKKYLFFVCVLFAFSSSSFADWQLDSEESILSFISVKKNTIAEVSQFKYLSGVVSENGDVSISIDLSSVDSKIGIRDARLKEVLFEVSKFSHAELTGQVDPSRGLSIKVGEFYNDFIDLSLSLHGFNKVVRGEVTIMKLSETKLIVSSARPVVINASDFGLVQGIEKLRALAGLSSIAMAIPVTFELVFNQK